MHATLPLMEISNFPDTRRRATETLQVNLGYKCNQSCLHCHVNAGPNRTELMERDTIFEVIAYLKEANVRSLDVTGGAPELNPLFGMLVESARKIGVHVIDRCNLTILFEPGQQKLAQFLTDQQVEIVASLPCYMEDNVDRQRGKGVFGTSIRALQLLNEHGYGQPDSPLKLNLAYNPQGAVLPPEQQQLQRDYKQHLFDSYGIVFNELYVITNMPIQRFGSILVSKGQFEHYMNVLKNAYQPANLDSVMCRTLLSVDWQGYVYDCDFNQMLELPLAWKHRPRTHLRELIGADLTGNPVVVKDHCYGCTAGQGSSCGGALGN